MGIAMHRMTRTGRHMTLFGLAAGWLWTGTAGAAFSWHDTPGEYLELQDGGRPVLRYMYAFDQSTPERAHETYKVYCHVFDGTGKVLVTKGPGGQYTHHRGIFYGFSRVRYDNGKQNDWWHMKQVTQRHRKFLAQEAGEDRARFTAVINWADPKGDPVLMEERTITVQRQPAPALALIDFESTLKAVRGAVVLDGDPEHAGFQFRPSDSVDKGPGGTLYRFPEEGLDVKASRDLPWAAMSFSLEGKRYSVEHMNHPGNPKGTRYSAYRNYGRFGAFFKKTMAKDETLTVKYRLWVLAGDLPEREQLQAQWQAFAGEAAAKP